MDYFAGVESYVVELRITPGLVLRGISLSGARGPSVVLRIKLGVGRIHRCLPNVLLSGPKVIFRWVGDLNTRGRMIKFSVLKQ